MTIRIAALASGRGSNLQAVLDAIAAGALDAELVGVFSDKPAAPALQRVPETLRWSHKPKRYASREDFDAALADAVAASRPDWVVCVGYMRILGEAFVRRFQGRLLNIHPSLLPKHKGLHTHARALEAGDAVRSSRSRWCRCWPATARNRWPHVCSGSNTRCWSRSCNWPLPGAWPNRPARPAWMVSPYLRRSG